MNQATTALLFALPVIVGGALHIAAIKTNLLPTLARWPLDAGFRWRGRRLWGANKTWRGVVVMAGATALASVVLRQALGTDLLAAHGLTFQAQHPLAWGSLLGLGYVAGELPNSLLKRQLDIAPGAAARGRWAPLFWVLDQCDSLAGLLAASCLAWRPPVAVVAWLIVITFFLHPLAALAMIGLGLKRRVG